MFNSPKFLVLHCSDVLENTIFDQYASINVYHRDERQFPRSKVTGSYIGYHRLITGNKLYICKQDLEEGAHCNNVVNGVSMNLQSIGICWGGDGDIEFPSSKHLAILKEQILLFMHIYNIPPERVITHRSLSRIKTCPGTLITDTFIRALTTPKSPDQIEKVESIKELQNKVTLLQKLVAALKELISLIKR